jgi:hypothetical protein
MITNPYAPPTAEVADVTSADEIQAPVYFAVSVTKLLVMYLVTLSFYQLYWFYKHWAMIKDRERRDVIPALRAIFAIFFAYSLFKTIRDDAKRYDVRPVRAVGMLATVWILLNLAERLPSPFDFVPFFSVLLLLPVQACANRINATIAPDHDPNACFTAWNWVGIAIGVLLIALIIVGLTIPEE